MFSHLGSRDPKQTLFDSLPGPTNALLLLQLYEGMRTYSLAFVLGTCVVLLSYRHILWSGLPHGAYESSGHLPVDHGAFCGM